MSNSIAGLGFSTSVPQEVEQEENGAYTQSGIRDVERRPMPRPHVDINEIDDLSEPDPVHKVSQGTGKEKRVSSQQAPLNP